jgi:CheY-like chemotaxis protein
MQKTGTASTVLVVEDDEPLLTLLARTLEFEGFRVLKAENGEVALQILGGLSRPPDIVLTDLAMPRMDGLEFAKILSAQDPSIPIIFMSGAPLFIAAGRIPQATGGTPLLDARARLLLKPFSPGVLLEAIAGALAHEEHTHRTPA